MPTPRHTYAFIKWVKDNGYPDILELLCANCHKIAGWELRNPGQ